MDIITLAAARKYTKDSIIGLGAIKGFPCQVAGQEFDEDGNTIIHLVWETNDGVRRTSDIKISKGEDAAKITDIVINEEGHLIIKMSDDTYYDAGEFSANGSLTEDLTATVDIGSVTSGKKYVKGTSLESIIKDMLIKVESPSVSISLNPATTVYDIIEEQVESIELIATVIKKTYAIAKVEFFVGGESVHTTTEGVATGGTFKFTYTPSTPIKTNTTFKATVTDVEGRQGNSSKSITFVGKSYYGTVGSTITSPTEADIKDLEGTVLKTSKAFEQQNIVTDYGKVLYAYPKSFGELTSIRDEKNNITYTGSFTKYELKVDGIDYLAYMQTDASKAANVTLKYS